MKKWVCVYHGCCELNDKGNNCNHPNKENLDCYKQSLSDGD